MTNEYKWDPYSTEFQEWEKIIVSSQGHTHNLDWTLYCIQSKERSSMYDVSHSFDDSSFLIAATHTHERTSSVSPE